MEGGKNWSKCGPILYMFALLPFLAIVKKYLLKRYTVLFLKKPRQKYSKNDT